MEEKATLMSNMINEAIQYFFHDKLLLYFIGNVIAMYLSIDKNIRHSKLAVNDINKVMWENLINNTASDFFFQVFQYVKIYCYGHAYHPHN